MRFLKIILSVFALFYRLTPNYLIISDVYFLHREVIETKIGNAVRSLSFYHLISVSIDMLSLVGFPCPTLLSLQPKINIKESITNVLSIILFIVFKYFDHFIALFFLYKIRRYYYDIIQAPYPPPILLAQYQMEAIKYHHHCHY